MDEVAARQAEAERHALSLLNAKLDQHIGKKCQNTKQLVEFAAIKHGWAFEGEFFNDVKDGPVLLTPGNFSLEGELYFTDKNTKYYSGVYPQEYLLQSGAVVTVMTDLTPDAKLLGMPAITAQGQTVLHNQRIGLLRFDVSSVLPRYMYYILLSDCGS